MTNRDTTPVYGSAGEPADLLAADEAWDRAYKDATTLPAWEQAEWLIANIGARFTAAGVGVRDARTVRRWRDDRVEPRDHAELERLQLLFRVSFAVTSVYGRPTVATSFLRSANPQLDDESPLILLATGDLEREQRRLLAATRAFLEG